MTKGIIKEVIPYVIIILVVLLIKQFIITPIQVNGSSMYPTLKNGDLMILNKIGYSFGSINRFDIVVIDTDNSYLIKRVIGLPGEEVKYEDNELYINNEKIEEPFLKDQVTNDLVVNLKDDCYFVLGDNRVNSRDSRDFGCFDRSKIRGKASFTFFPFDRLGVKN